MGSRPPSFAEVAATLVDLPVALRIVRQSRQLTLRDVEAQSGVSFNALSRLERGRDCSLSNARAVLLWLDCCAQVDEDDDADASATSAIINSGT